MAWVATGVTVANGLYQADASSRAASAQKDAAKRADATQRYMYDQTREDQQPWREAGEGALSQILNGMGMGDDPNAEGFGGLTQKFSDTEFQADPGYQYRLEQGQKALERSASARGGLNSGALMKSLGGHAQGMASAEYQNAYNRFNNDQSNRFNRLSSLAGVGQTANSQLQQAGQNYANQSSNIALQHGNAAAAGQIGQANAVSGAVQGGVNNWLQNQMMNRMFPEG